MKVKTQPQIAQFIIKGYEWRMRILVVNNQVNANLFSSKVAHLKLFRIINW